MKDDHQEPSELAPPYPEEEASQPDESRFKDTLAAHLSIGVPGLAQMTAFCRQLATLIDVGIPLVQALVTLSRRVEHPRLKKIIADVARRVEEGDQFSEALAAHRHVFSPLVINVVRIGESAGILEGALQYLADIMERRYELRRKVASALAYPLAALLVCGMVILVILGIALPVFREVYTAAEVEHLPALTEYVLALSAFVQQTWYLLILLCAVIWFSVRYLIRNHPAWRRAFDLFCLKAPIVRIFAIKINVTRSSRTVANLLRAGIPLLEALTITAETSENVIIAEMFKAVHDNLEQGGQLDLPFREKNLFPPLVIDMIAVGDEAGRLDIMFEKIAETYDNDVNQSIATLNAIIEPAMILVMGLIVLVLALAVLLPYWKIAAPVAD